MPPAKRSSPSTPKSKSTTRKPAAAKSSAAPQAKATATTARKSTARTATQAKSGTTRTANAAKAGVKSTARAARTGAKATATTAATGAKQTSSRAKATQTRAKATNSRGRDTVTLTRARVQEALDSAAERGHITRKDANALVADIMRRGRHTGDEVGELLDKGRKSIETATKKVRKADPVDAIVRGADRARRVAGVGPSFPIVGYDDLNVSQVQVRIKELSRPEQRKVLNYERKHANRKSVVGALEKSLG